MTIVGRVLDHSSAVRTPGSAALDSCLLAFFVAALASCVRLSTSILSVSTSMSSSDPAPGEMSGGASVINSCLPAWTSRSGRCQFARKPTNTASPCEGWTRCFFCPGTLESHSLSSESLIGGGMSGSFEGRFLNIIGVRGGEGFGIPNGSRFDEC